MHKHLLISILLLILCTSCLGNTQKHSQDLYSTSFNSELNESRVLVFSGDYITMGENYGFTLKKQLNDSLNILKDFYIVSAGATWSQMVNEADKLYSRYPNGMKQKY